LRLVKLKPVKRVPLLITLSVVALVGFIRWLHWDLFEKFECITYDMRAREALRFPHSVATNLGFVSIDEASLRYVHTNRGLGRVGFGLYWPRQIFGRLVDELKEQGAKAVAMDVIFGDLRPDHPSVEMANGRPNIDSDVFFAIQLQRASNAILAVTKDVAPPALFRTNAMALGDIETDKDSDGVLRRALAFRIYTNWHSAFRQVAADPEYGVDLDKARVEAGQVVLARSPDLGDIKIPLDQEGNFDVADIGGTDLPAGQSGKAKPFTLQRRWHMGVVLAAQELNLDLDQAQVDLAQGRIELRGPAGVVRTIPVEPDGSFYIDWCIPPERTSVLTHQPIQALLDQYLRRLKGEGPFADVWRGKLVVVGSGAVEGNDLVDHGATPLLKDTLLVSKHWNVANSIITDRFVHRAGLGVELALIAFLGFLAGAATWEFPPFRAIGLVALVLIVYIGLAIVLYVRYRYWIPLVFPLAGGLLANVCLLVWRVVFEQAEQRRVKSIFSKVVSPKIVNELLAAETLSLDGARHEVTVLFADVRGFTEWTDQSQERAAEHVRQHGLIGAGAEAYYDVQARETLHTANLYLGVIADVIKQQDGTVDKFIGDCVMAFWGAPTPNPKHASACVKAAIQAQRAMHDLNQMRAAENQRRQEANPGRVAAGQPELPLLPVLLLGTGINTGPVMAGLMGSGAAESESLNYTVFGREVNLASRLEGASGRGRIFIGERTLEHLQREDPALAATCIARDPLTLKGFRAAIKVYEVPWQKIEGEPQKPSAATAQELPVAKA
jgi:class 3 adenylate cyclase/CHASE2 domain-containing sensor protein